MKDFRLLKFFLFAVLWYSCQAKEEQVGEGYFDEDDLPEVISLKGRKYEFTEILNPKGIHLQDGIVVIFEVKHVGDDKFHIIDLANEEYLQTKGIDGLGPGEISVISQIEADSDRNKIWTYDPELRLFSKFSLSDSSRLAEDQYRAPETSFYITQAVHTSDSTLLGNAVDGWTKYLHLTKSGDTLALFGDWKDMVQGKEFPRGVKAGELDANLVSNLFQGPLRISPDKKHAIKFGMQVDFIDIIDVEKQQINTIYGPDKGIQDFKLTYWDGFQMPVFNPSSTTRYADGYAGMDSFYVLFRGKPYSQISSPDNPNRIFEFDYEGNILNQYQLDYPLFGFAVDEANRAIYGVTVDSEPNLVRFDY